MDHNKFKRLIMDHNKFRRTDHSGWQGLITLNTKMILKYASCEIKVGNREESHKIKKASHIDQLTPLPTTFSKSETIQFIICKMS